MTAKYQVGEAVAVRVAYPKGHCRTPYYCRGKNGVVERICGEFRNPEQLAYGRDGLPRQPLYRVRFRQAELWDGYDGAPEDAIEIEIYEHWLEPVAAA
ncbi:MAG: nitrile hydratase subunit beta [Alphaproteobacteria bacterium]|jgi:nitrile hydratase|nr:nitrile hydratase subunit beta [Alphaproteobacteria bacterium]